MRYLKAMALRVTAALALLFALFVGAASFRAHRVAAHAWAEAAEARDAESRVVLLRRAASQQAITSSIPERALDALLDPDLGLPRVLSLRAARSALLARAVPIAPADSRIVEIERAIERAGGGVAVDLAARRARTGVARPFWVPGFFVAAMVLLFLAAQRTLEPRGGIRPGAWRWWLSAAVSILLWLASVHWTSPLAA